MKNISVDQKLKKKRLDLGLSLKDASKIIGISRLLLYLYEYGYFAVSRKNEEKFIKAYKLDEDFFSSSLCYLSGKQIDQKHYVSFLHFLKSKVLLIIASIFTIIMVGLSLSSAYGFNYVTDNEINYYEDKVTEVQQTLRENETKNEYSKAYEDNISYYEFTYDGLDYYSKTYEKDKHINYNCFGSKIADGEDSYLTEFYVKKEVVFDFQLFIGAKSDTIIFVDDYSYKKYLTNKEIEIYVIDNVNGKYSKINKGDEGYDFWQKLLQESVDNTYLAFSTAFNSDPLNIDISLEEYLSLNCQGYVAFNHQVNIYSTTLMVSAISSICGIGVISFVIFLFVSERKRKVKVNKKEKIKPTKEAKVYEPIEKNQRFGPVIPEWLIRVLGLIVLFLASIGTFVILVSYLHILDMFTPTQAITYTNITKNLLNVAVIILFFTVLNVFTKNKNGAFKVYMFILAGFIYYAFQTVTLFFYVSREIVGYTYMEYQTSPQGNAIWSTTVFLSLALFLLTTPEFAKKKKGNRVFWRCLSIIPVGYLITGYVIYILINKGVLTGLYYPFSFLFISNNVILGLFSILTIVSLYIYRLIIRKKYGEENEALFLSGNKYQLTRNVIVAAVVALVALLDFLINAFYPTNPFSLGNNYYILTLIPFILLYHQHVGKRNSVLDITYASLYGIILLSSYFAIYVLRIFIG